MAERGTPLERIVATTGVPRSTAHRWISRRTPTDARPPTRCWVCDGAEPSPAAAESYPYVLGQYLGDGHLVTSSRTPVLRIYACTDYPEIMESVREAVSDVRGVRPGVVRPSGSGRVLAVQSYWKHWPCLLPQHGRGLKHRREIRLADWQERLVAEHPWPFLRGLIHSDGCRSVNRVVVRGRAYEYPRYFFANESADILAIAGRTLDQLGVAWRYNRPNSMSIARRASVALLDAHIGPKR